MKYPDLTYTIDGPVVRFIPNTDAGVIDGNARPMGKKLW